MDGTFLNNDRTVSLRNCNLVKRAEDAGVFFVPSTGRPLAGIRKYEKELRLNVANHYAICFNGALVVETATERIVSKVVITGAEVKKLIQIAHHNNVFWHAFSLDRGLLYEKDNPATDIEITYNNISATKICEDDIRDDELFYKFMFCGDEKGVDALDLNTKFLRSDYTVLRSMYCFLEILNKKTSKGEALRALCKALNISIAETVAFGDADNDVHMLEAAGQGYVMENGSEIIKANPKFKIAPKNSDDGVAVISEKLIQDLA